MEGNNSDADENLDFLTPEKMRAALDSDAMDSDAGSAFEDPPFKDVKCYLVESDFECEDYPAETEQLLQPPNTDEKLLLEPPAHLVKPVLAGLQAKLRNSGKKKDKEKKKDKGTKGKGKKGKGKKGKGRGKGKRSKGEGKSEKAKSKKVINSGKGGPENVLAAQESKGKLDFEEIILTVAFQNVVFSFMHRAGHNLRDRHTCDGPHGVTGHFDCRVAAVASARWTAMKSPRSLPHRLEWLWFHGTQRMQHQMCPRL